MDHSEGRQAHVAIGDFKTFVASSESNAWGIATGMRIGVAKPETVVLIHSVSRPHLA
jgi:hypothetical protein